MINLIATHPTSKIVTANKELVDRLLEMNTHNRSPKKTAIERLFVDIKAGAFMLTASGVGVSSTGVLLDGQHRLMAMRLAGYPELQFVLVTGLSIESQKAVDRHAKRSLADVLSLHMNITVSTHMVALAKASHFHGAVLGKFEKFVMSQGHQADSDTAQTIAEHGDLMLEVINAAASARAPVLAALFVYALHDKTRAIEFCRDIAKGINLSEDHPAYRLRLAVERMKKDASTTGRHAIFKIAVTAVITHASGRTVKLLKESDSWGSAPWKWQLAAA
jgi:hypothetical protein